MRNRLAFLLVLVLSTALFTIQIYHVKATDDSWTSKASLPQTGVEGAAVLNGMIYAVGSSFLYKYNPALDSWVVKNPMPTPRTYFAVAACQGKIYVIGGQIVGGSDTGLNEAYDPVTDKWETRAQMPTARRYIEANGVNGKVYVIGGWIENPSKSLFENEVYDPANDSWTEKAPSPYPVFHYASTVLDGKIYVIDGQTDGYSSYPGFSDWGWNQIYDVEADRWSQGARFPTDIYLGFAAGATTGVKAPKRIYVIGGDWGLAPENFNFVYDPLSDVWGVGASMPTNRSDIAVAVVDDVLYAIGGYVGWHVFPGSLSTVVEQYTPSGYNPSISSPTATATSPPPVATVSPSLFICVAAVSGAVVAAGLIVYFKRFHRKAESIT